MTQLVKAIVQLHSDHGSQTRYRLAEIPTESIEAILHIENIINTRWLYSERNEHVTFTEAGSLLKSGRDFTVIMEKPLDD